MEEKQKFNRDILYKIILKSVDNCQEYCLVNANDDNEIYLILKEEEILNI